MPSNEKTTALFGKRTLRERAKKIFPAKAVFTGGQATMGNLLEFYCTTGLIVNIFPLIFML